MACGNSDPDVETIRSFLDKGAYVNWRDLQGRTAFDLVLYSQQRYQQKIQASASSLLSSSSSSSSSSVETTNNHMLDTAMLINNNNNYNSSSNGLDDSFRSNINNNNVDNDNDSEDGSIDDEDIITRGSSINSTPPKSFKAFGKSTFTSSSSNRFSLGSSASNIYNKKPDDSSSIIDNTRRRRMSSGSILINSATTTTTTSTFINQGDKQQKWRAMENTIKQVGDWAVKALPALLEISKRGGRYRPQQDSLLSTLRPSFRAAIEEAQGVWCKAQQPQNFVEFVQVREQSGEDLLLHKSNWTKDKVSSICQLCSEGFSLRVRRHHCRSCGVLTCDDCSSKRLILSSNLDGDNNNNHNEYLLENNNTSSINNSKKIKSEERTSIITQYQRVCDGCFNRLCYEASQPSPDHFRVKQLKSCALDVIASMEGLVQALDSLDSTSATRSIINNFNKDFEQMLSIGNSSDINTKRTSISNLLITPEKSTGMNQLQSHKSLTTNTTTTGTTTGVPSNINTQYDEVLLEVLKSRELKVKHAEDIVAKFLEVT